MTMDEIAEKINNDLVQENITLRRQLEKAQDRLCRVGKPFAKSAATASGTGSRQEILRGVHGCARGATVTLYEILMAQRALLDSIPPCSCGPEYTNRGLVAPDCIRCQLEPELSAAENAMQSVVLYEGMGVPNRALVMEDELFE